MKDFNAKNCTKFESATEIVINNDMATAKMTRITGSSDPNGSYMVRDHFDMELKKSNDGIWKIVRYIFKSLDQLK